MSGSSPLTMHNMSHHLTQHTNLTTHHTVVTNNNNNNLAGAINVAGQMLKCKKARTAPVAKFGGGGGHGSMVANTNNNNQVGGHPLPTSVARRNERERNRVKMVNNGFAVLRQHVPNGGKNKKMSKVETLRSAVEYIRQLQKLLGQTGGGDSCYSTDDEQYQSLNLAGTSGDENSYPLGLGDIDIDSNASMLDSPPQHLVYSNTGGGDVYGQHIYIASSEAEAQHNVHYMLNNNQQQHQQQQQQSPAPSIGSDLTGSSSSPFAEVSQHTYHHQTQPAHLAPNHQHQHQSQEHHHHQHQSTTNTTAAADNSSGGGNLLSSSVDDELLEFVNWF